MGTGHIGPISTKNILWDIRRPVETAEASTHVIVKNDVFCDVTQCGSCCYCSNRSHTASNPWRWHSSWKPQISHTTFFMTEKDVSLVQKLCVCFQDDHENSPHPSQNQGPITSLTNCIETLWKHCCIFHVELYLRINRNWYYCVHEPHVSTNNMILESVP
jgi:hypothetical protein